MVIQFTRQLYILVKAGVPLLNALQIVCSQIEPGKFKSALERIISAIQEGSSLSEALSTEPRFFSLFYVNMIKAAEVSGNLVGILKELSEQLTRQHRVARQVQSAFVYPLLVLFTAGAILVILFIFVIPVFMRIFQDLGGNLPPATLFVIGVSKFLVHWGWLFLSLFIILLAAIIFLSQKPYGKYLLNVIIWRTPLFGNVIKIVHIGRFCRTLGTMLASGVGLMKGLEVLEETSLSVVLQKVIAEIKLKVEQGKSLSSSMEENKIFSPSLVKMIQVGEESGKLAELFLDAAADYEEDVTYAMTGFLSILEPALIIIMGGIIGFIVIALFFPIFTISSLIR